MGIYQGGFFGLYQFSFNWTIDKREKGFPINNQISDNTLWMFLDDLKHRKEKQ